MEEEKQINLERKSLIRLQRSFITRIKERGLAELNKDLVIMDSIKHSNFG